MFDSPSFIQKIMLKKKPSRNSHSKQHIRPLYTSEMMTTELGVPWKKQLSKIYSSPKTKTYNIPQLSPSASSTTTSTASLDSNSAISQPQPSSSSVIQPEQPLRNRKRRPLSSEILIQMMDQNLLLKKQRHHQPSSPKTTVSITQHTHDPQKRLLKSSTILTMPVVHKKPSSSIFLDFPYVLTQDNDEQDRMVAQHYLLRTAFGSDFNSPIRSQLRKGIVVLDIGCGPGTWTMEMSTAFPKSTFIGIDQGTFYPKDIKPRNCHFRTCDSLVSHNDNNEGDAIMVSLPFPDSSIDYIYQRDMNWALKGQAWQLLLLEYQRILKPGGWIEFVEPDLETQNSLENECYMNDKLISGLSLRQQDPYAVHRLPTMLSITGFKRVEDVFQTFPLGWGTPHSNSTVEGQGNEVNSTSKQRHCSEFARAMSSQYLFLLKSLKPWLSNVMNLSSEKYDEYIAGLPEEWRHAQTYINWHCIIAQKPYAS
ncbi:MAG: hypothetical protein EXX96DRAFT_552178 [Benjaminiella poitrasii]|nr:MAG: hypothetical protein EXX96DRAFT_552178 [Benjaminiella poitrasii]